MRIYRDCCVLCAMVLLSGSAAGADTGSLLVDPDFGTTFLVALTEDSPVGAASIREHAIIWHPDREKYYLIADVVPLASRHHPNTYDTELHLWSSTDLRQWTYHGVAVTKGDPGETYDGYGVASPAGLVFFRGRLYAAFSARRTDRFEQRGIGLAWSGKNPERLPWTKSERPVSDVDGEDDDAAVVVAPGDDRLHLYHRRTGPGGYRIAYAFSATPQDPASWAPAVDVTRRPADVRAQELTAALFHDGKFHLLIIEHLHQQGVKIAHLASVRPDGVFQPAESRQRYLPSRVEPRQSVYSGHISPVLRGEGIVGWFWTCRQQGARYGLQGHPSQHHTR